MAPAFIAAGASIGVAVLAGLGERRRAQRRDPDGVGWVDWRTVQMAALLAAMLCLSIGFNAG
ncbi:MAG TPA: hypothetical protein VM900_14775 [Sphingomonas sp.]|jgi:hypothetical protein|nr:hypothetical protein [Sphingomonas sp.]